MSPNLDGLGGVIEAEADLLCFLGLGGATRRLQHWDLQVIGGTVLASLTMLAI